MAFAKCRCIRYPLTIRILNRGCKGQIWAKDQLFSSDMCRTAYRSHIDFISSCEYSDIVSWHVPDNWMVASSCIIPCLSRHCQCNMTPGVPQLLLPAICTAGAKLLKARHYGGLRTTWGHWLSTLMKEQWQLVRSTHLFQPKTLWDTFQCWKFSHSFGKIKSWLTASEQLSANAHWLQTHRQTP